MDGGSVVPGDLRRGWWKTCDCESIPPLLPAWLTVPLHVPAGEGCPGLAGALGRREGNGCSAGDSSFKCL